MKIVHKKSQPLPFLGAVATNTLSEVARDSNGRPLSAMTTTGGWDGSGAHGGANFYAPFLCEDARFMSFSMEWFDATSDATITVEFTNAPANGPGSVTDYDEASNAWQEDSSISITGPGGTAAGGEGVNLSNVGWKRGRFKVVMNANTDMVIWPHAKE